MKYGNFSVGDEVNCQYDELRRQPIRNNHTGTHVLNYGLREVLGNEVDQKGSLVAPEKLRFDFSHKSAVSEAELRKVEDIATKYIRQNSEVYSKDVPLATAKAINGVRAVFGETYPDPVRVVSIGVPVEDLLEEPSKVEWGNVSIEFCGGTHVEKTGEIKELVIIEESGIAKGIRRIIAVTGQTAYDVQREAETFREKLDSLYKMPYSPEKEAREKELNVEFKTLSISTLTKKELEKRLAEVNKEILKHQKEAQKAENEKVLMVVKDYFAQKGNETSTVLVAKVPGSTSSKAVSEAIKFVSTKEKGKTVYLLAADETSGKVTHGCYVADVRIPLLPFRD
jgi:alanyl-tRNA synthetase